jgi:glutamine amidotransferase
MISILNYGMGNLASIQGMFKKVGVQSQVISSAAEIGAATSLVVPGVGQFDNAMSRMESLGLRAALDEAAMTRRIPILGVCLGMQLMTRRSEEGKLPGFGWIDAETRRVAPRDSALRVPHMGWNLIHGHGNSPYFAGDGLREHRFYFVHAYAVQCNNPSDVVATTTYGEDFVSVCARDNLLGVQFHPEKSHKFGASFLLRYATLHGLHAEAAA